MPNTRNLRVRNGLVRHVIEAHASESDCEGDKDC